MGRATHDPTGGPGRRLRSHPPGVPGTATSVDAEGLAAHPTTTTGSVAPAVGEEDGENDADGLPPDRLEAGLRTVLVVMAVIAWLSAGLLVLLALTMTPRPGLSGGAALFKAADVVGWLVLGVVVALDARARRRRTVYVALGAWAWVFVLSWLVAQTAYALAGEGVAG
jgi:hypothetical protein